MLDNLVGSSLGTSTTDGGVTVTLQGESILADIDPPDIPMNVLAMMQTIVRCWRVLDGARSLAVDTLDLVLADNSILEGSTVLDGENSILVSTLDLACARNTTAVGLHATIENAGDRLRRLEGNRALGGRNGKGSALVQAEVSGSAGGRSSSNGCDERGEGGNGSDGELHFVDWRMKLSKSKEGFVVKVCIKKVMLCKSVSSERDAFSK
jgi:hypothetical protein